MWQNGIKTFHKSDSTAYIAQTATAATKRSHISNDVCTIFGWSCIKRSRDKVLPLLLSFHFVDFGSFVILCHLSIFHLQWHCDFSFKRCFSIHFILMLNFYCARAPVQTKTTTTTAAAAAKKSELWIGIRAVSLLRDVSISSHFPAVKIPIDPKKKE